ncbi:MAG: HAD-IA family hydrolase [Ruegeria sp.]|uniref:HAD-IA family hydrolase n=1 Tax=Ruegeria sp. TaxID=1879320 RepID=UPI00349E98E1
MSSDRAKSLVLDIGGVISKTHSATHDLTETLKPAAYESLVAKLGSPAEDCVFVDDQRRGIDGAWAVGMTTVHFDVMNPGQSFAEAERPLGLEERIAG